MKNLIIITVMLLVLTSCASGFNRLYEYNSYTALPNKAMAIALNSYGQATGGWGSAGGYTLSQAKSEALKKCKQFNPQSTCVLERENNIYVFNQRLASYRKQEQQNYIASIRAKCRSYGFVADNAIAVCVQKEIQKNEQIRVQMNQQIAQQNRINSQNRARAFSELGKTLLESGQQKTNTQPKKVCIYECGFETVTVDEFMCPMNITYKGKQCYQR